MESQTAQSDVTHVETLYNSLTNQKTLSPCAALPIASNSSEGYHMQIRIEER